MTGLRGEQFRETTHTCARERRTTRSGRQLERRTTTAAPPYFHSAGSLVIRQLILVEGSEHGDELGDATGSLVLIVRLLLVRVILPISSPPPNSPVSPFRHRTFPPPLFPAIASLSLTCRFFRGRNLFSFPSPRRLLLYPPYSLLNCVLTGVHPGSDDIIDGGH